MLRPGVQWGRGGWGGGDPGGEACGAHRTVCPRRPGLPAQVPDVAGVGKVLGDTAGKRSRPQLGVTRWPRTEEGQPGEKEGHWALRDQGTESKQLR